MVDREKAYKALQQALRLEKEGQAFYLQAADETLDEHGREMFLSLADDESKHAEMVQRQIKALQDTGEYVAIEDLSVEAIDLEDQLFPPERDAVEEKIGSNPSDLDALHIALENEIESFDLYRQAANSVEDEAAYQMYCWLASAERQHFDLLMNNYRALSQGGGFV